MSRSGQENIFSRHAKPLALPVDSVYNRQDMRNEAATRGRQENGAATEVAVAECATTIDNRAIVPDWFWSHVDRSAGPDACHPWTGAHTKEGYGLITRNNTSTTAPRFLWECVNGKLPRELVVDHVKCDNPPCCNLAHLAPATQRVNILRGTSPSARQARQTHCKRGHAFTPENTYRQPSNPTRRICVACMRITAVSR